MNVHDRVTASMRSAASQVFSTMLGLELAEGEAYLESTPPQANDGVVSFIGLAGTWVGTGSISCSAPVACRLCSLLLMTESTAVDEEVLDAIAELTNMIIGNVKTDLERELGQLGLSIPTVVFGKNFKARAGGQTEWSAVRYLLDGEPLQIKLCLTPSQESNCRPIPHGSVSTCAVDV